MFAVVATVITGVIIAGVGLTIVLSGAKAQERKEAALKSER